jgi:UDP-glucose 4-epimerase
MNKILITGGTGFVGGRLAKRLSVDNEVYVSSRKPIDKSSLALYGDVIAVEHRTLFFADRFPAVDTVIHLAAMNEWDSAKHPSEAIRVNVGESQAILENSIRIGARRFIYFSTAHVYGAPLTGKISEETVPVPVHPYSSTHLAAENHVIEATLQNRIQGIVLRLSNSFGAPVSPAVNRWTLLTNDLCRQAVENGKMKLKSNGCQYRDFICLSDVEEIIASIVERKSPLKHIVYNLGSGIPVRVIDMVKLIAQMAVTVLKKNVLYELPHDAKETIEPGLEFSIDRLLEEGFKITNDVNLEIERLLQFCAEHFTA